MSATLPHTTRELGVLLPALARRSSISAPRAGTGFWIDPVGLTVGYREKTTKLQSREAALLHCFARHAGVPLTTTRLGTYLWGAGRPLTGRTRGIAVHVWNLRRELRAIGLAGVIQTLYSNTYRHECAYRFDLPTWSKTGD